MGITPEASTPEQICGRFCGDCKNRGNYKGPVNPEHLIAEADSDGVSLQFAQPPGKRGRAWNYSADQGAGVDTIAGERIAQLSPSQTLAVGTAIVKAMAAGCEEGCAFSPDAVDVHVQWALSQHEDLDKAADF